MSNMQGPPASAQGQVTVQMTGLGPAVLGHTLVGIGDECTGQLAGATPFGFVGVTGAYGSSTTGVGVFGFSNQNDGVQGRTQAANHAGVSGVNDGGGIGVYGRGAPAGRFDGPVIANGPMTVNGNTTLSGTLTAGTGGAQLAVHVSGSMEIDGDLTILNGKDIRLADFAEDFDCSGECAVEPGSVVVLNQQGAVQLSESAYDKKVAGVVSGAGDFRPAITLDRQPSPEPRMPVALLGKVYCKVDSRYAAIEVGDLLTTSPTPGHAMKAIDRDLAFGAVIGKALCPLSEGRGLIPILITLQ